MFTERLTRHRATVWTHAVILSLFMAMPFFLPSAEAQSSSQPAPASPAKPEGEAEQKADEGWRERFDKVYRLDEGQVVKRIAPPWIPERTEYFRNEARPRGPTYCQFVWDGKLKSWAAYFVGKTPLSRVLRDLGLQRYEYEGSAELLELPLPGDWIVREGSSHEARLAALEKIIRDERAEPVRFVRKQVERPVVLARGRFEFRPLKEASHHKECVHIFVDDLGSNERDTEGTGTKDEFLRWVGDRLNRRIINETTGSASTTAKSRTCAPSESSLTLSEKRVAPPKPTTLSCRVKGEVSWANHESSEIRDLPEGEAKDGIVQKVLANLVRQTSLKFVQERRKVDMWFVIEGGTSQPSPTSK